MTDAGSSRRLSDSVRLGIGLSAVVAVTLIYVKWLQVSNAATVSTTFLLVVLLVAATSRLWVAVVTSIVAMLCFNFFFLPPVGTLTIADPHNWIALFAFLAVSLVASNLSAIARERTQEAVGRRDELARLFNLSRDVLLMTDSREAISMLARSIANRFDLDFVAIALPRSTEWDLFEGGAQSIALDTTKLTSAFATVRLGSDASDPSSSGHRVMLADNHTVQLVPLRVGAKPIGLLAGAGRPIEVGTLDTLAGMVALAIERAQFLEERKRAELTRQSEQLKTALLASLGHDLRTPLTAIRVAATNIKAAWLTPDDRIEQSNLILAEVERLSRLFQNILEMARIDAGAIATENRWTHPSEIVAAARDQVEHTLDTHRMNVSIERDVPVRLDPRLTASAVAHLLENAAQYASPDSSIDVVVRLTEEGLVVQVRDHGPGIDAVDLPHVFERFYRGTAGNARASGTGMGLWIARGLLAVETGRIWAENCPDGGAQFTVLVPAAVKESEPAASPVQI
jgi:two-component system, OmpR family, sensor histidine kinase KdpD